MAMTMLFIFGAACLIMGIRQIRKDKGSKVETKTIDPEIKAISPEIKALVDIIKDGSRVKLLPSKETSAFSRVDRIEIDGVSFERFSDDWVCIDKETAEYDDNSVYALSSAILQYCEKQRAMQKSEARTKQEAIIKKILEGK